MIIMYFLTTSVISRMKTENRFYLKKKLSSLIERRLKYDTIIIYEYSMRFHLISDARVNTK